MRKLESKQSGRSKRLIGISRAALFGCELYQVTPGKMSDKNQKEIWPIKERTVWLQNTKVLPQMARFKVFLESKSQARAWGENGVILGKKCCGKEASSMNLDSAADKVTRGEANVACLRLVQKNPNPKSKSRIHYSNCVT